MKGTQQKTHEMFRVSSQTPTSSIGIRLDVKGLSDLSAYVAGLFCRIGPDRWERSVYANMSGTA